MTEELESSDDMQMVSVKLELYENVKENLSKTTETCVSSTLDVALRTVVEKAVFQAWPDADMRNIKCQSGNICSEYIDLHSKLNEISYITDLMRQNYLPTIIVLREVEFQQVPSSPPLRASRTLSNFLRGMIGGIQDPIPLPWESLGPTHHQLEMHVEREETEQEVFSQVKLMPSHFTSLRNPSHFTSFIDIAVDDLSLSVASGDSTSGIHKTVRSTSSIRPNSNTMPRQLSEVRVSPKLRRSFFSTTSRTSRRGEVSGPIVKKAVCRNASDENSMPDAIPDLSYSFKISNIFIEPEESPSFTVNCREFMTVGELKSLVQHEMKRKSLVLSDRHNKTDVTLTYEVKHNVYELYDDNQFIYRTALYQSWKAENVVTSAVKMTFKESNWELPTLYRISRLTGVLLDKDVALSVEGTNEIGPLASIAVNDRMEVDWARRTLHSYVDELVRERDGNEYALSMELETGETPLLLALKLPLDNKVEITFHHEDMFTLKRYINVNEYASSVLREVFHCVVVCGLVENKIEKYTMQTTGEQSYLDGDHEMISFRCIRKSILKSEPIHLSITKKPTCEDDRTCEVNWLPIDPFSGQPPIHTDISRKHKKDFSHEISAASVWDQDEEFALLVSRVDNLPIPTTKEFKRLSIAITATIYHASQALVDKTQTRACNLNMSGSIECQETLLFGLQIKNLPKAAKIMICVQDEASRKDSTRKRQMNIYYWGLVPVFDHRGILQNGQYTVSLWKGPTNNSKLNYGDFSSFDANPCAPCNNNPDPHTVRVTIQFPRYSYPVFFPSCAPETCSFLLSHESNNRKQVKKLLLCLSQGQLPMSAFANYLARIDWSRLPQVIEVYSLLQEVEAEQTLPVETSLKLLDGEFADENVRSFAVRVLETLPDEQLEDFLLQLTQALKFERCHDSALARLLLRRALKNKRIGHFFFWYLKCEMYNPLFTPRFSVLLEAYLKGCGEAMLKRFENQLAMQTQLEEIGRKVEVLGDNDTSKMQTILQDLLKKEGMPTKQIIPVYNPRILLGRLNPAKCKIMSSKKRPQWLEMCNVDPSALRQMPTRLILKLGDDLRQDVIVLRMLSLFEKLWEKEGLPDLCLIPYGCMATGPNSGFIEVVKNARTIADVSGINNNKKLYEWIRTHQKNEFGESDPELMKEAINRFSHSCAGYTVASYVLGIGDRHNDNIMITTSGNLFHIDFGHFLGNIKYFLGVKREWAPFVLTPDFVYVMGGENSDTFNTYKNLCCRAFLCLRRHHELIFNLFSLMRSTGIPELACVEDARYIRDALMLTKTDHEAEIDFRQLIRKCLDLQWTVQIMWWIHKQRNVGNSN